MADISESTKQKIQQFQELQQQARILISQKYQMELQLKETKSAVEELEKTAGNDVFKAVGQILIKTDREKILSELREKAETLDIRLKAVDKQEKKTVEKIKEIQSALQRELSGGAGEMPAGEGR